MKHFMVIEARMRSSFYVVNHVFHTSVIIYVREETYAHFHLIIKH